MKRIKIDNASIGEINGCKAMTYFLENRDIVVIERNEDGSIKSEELDEQRFGKKQYKPIFEEHAGVKCLLGFEEITYNTDPNFYKTGIEREEFPMTTEIKKEASKNKRGGKEKMIEVVKDGKVIATIEGVQNTFKWARENNICHTDWVKDSLKLGIETKPGRKYTEGGYLFRYVK